MKTRSKSPGASLQQVPKEAISTNVEFTTNPSAKLHPVHVRLDPQ